MLKQSTSLKVRLPALVVALEVVMLFLYAVFVTYDDDADAKMQTNETRPMDNTLYRDYHFFADVQVMIFVGFGCLLAFLRLYGFSGMVFNFLTATFAIQWAILVQGYFQFYSDGKIHLGVINLLNAEFACAVVLISFGAVLGKVSPVQLLVMALLEVPVFSVTEWAVLKYIKINDAGGSILIHLFACYFGLAVTFVLFRPSLNDGHAKDVTCYQSDILSLMGTLFLWVFWPSFNSALTLKGDDQHRAVLHTFIGLSSSTLTAFAFSAMLNKRGKLTLADIQNVTLAGGVTVGATVDMMITPAAAFALGVMGCTACMTSAASTTFTASQGSSPRWRGICAILLATEETYGPSLYETFAYRAPPEGDPKLLELQKLIPGLKPGLGRSGKEQAVYQVAALFCTVSLAALGGIVTGFVLKLPFLASPSDEWCYDDEVFFEVPSDFDSPGLLKVPIDSQETKV
ncbi:hypothetical protein SKAU_G00151540 [Synaphobranchus kaupii]|uniref:Ammonium transporter AmtB-like domain-containing protein n=1 Tax=Synaphobranchus kaupii TaxID=118154 RepID=A0A9Q1FH25_SYNKA|nr:hypothetical protein SKAU_G00151540 [Synaphobranchus kaupii]